MSQEEEYHSSLLSASWPRSRLFLISSVMHYSTFMLYTLNSRFTRWALLHFYSTSHWKKIGNLRLSLTVDQPKIRLLSIIKGVQKPSDLLRLEENTIIRKGIPVGFEIGQRLRRFVGVVRSPGLTRPRTLYIDLISGCSSLKQWITLETHLSEEYERFINGLPQPADLLLRITPSIPNSDSMVVRHDVGLNQICIGSNLLAYWSESSRRGRHGFGSVPVFGNGDWYSKGIHFGLKRCQIWVERSN